MLTNRIDLALSATFFLIPFVVAQEFPLAENAWEAPGEDDVRSPCPFINAIANHGLINHSGKDVDMFEMVTVLSDTFDVAPPLFNFLASASIDLGFTTTDENGTVIFDIDTLFNHNKLEHDASFVRVDEYFGAEKSKLVDNTLLQSLMDLNPNSDMLTVEDIKNYQYSRVLDSRQNNPEVYINSTTQGTSFAAQATLLLVLGQDPELAVVGKDRLEELLRFDRLPAGFIPKVLSDPDFVPHDIIAAGTLGNDLLLDFKTNFDAALDADLPTTTTTGTTETTNAPTSPSSGSISVTQTTELVLVSACVSLGLLFS